MALSQFLFQFLDRCKPIWASAEEKEESMLGWQMHHSLWATHAPSYPLYTSTR